MMQDDLEEGVEGLPKQPEAAKGKKAKTQAKSPAAESPLRDSPASRELDVGSPATRQKRKREAVALSNRAKLPKGQKKCTGCKRLRPVEMFAWNQGKCFTCKADGDKIYAICKKQDKLEWLKSQKEDGEKYQCLLENFQKHSAQFKAGDVPAKWSAVTYIEELKAASEFLIADQGKMMNEEQYVEFSGSPAAEIRLTPQQAKAQWATWAADPAASEKYFTGDKASNNLKFRIPTGMHVDFNTRLSLSKRLDMVRDKPKKNATPEDVKAMTGKLLTDHSSIGAGALDFHALAPNLLKAGGEALMAKDLQVGDISAMGLQPDTEEDEEEENADDTNADPKPAAKWWNKEKAINDAMRSSEDLLKRARQETTTLLGEVNNLVKLAERAEEQEISFWRQELVICTTKRDCLSCLLGDAAALDSFTQKFSASTQDAQAAASCASKSASAKEIHCMGSAPPCERWEDLQVFNILESGVNQLLGASSAQELANLQKDIRDSLVPIRNLFTASKIAKADLERRRKTYHDQVLEKSRKKQESVERQGDGVAFFQHMSRCLPELPQLRLSEIDSADWTQPFIVTSLQCEEFPQDIVAAVDGFKTNTWGKAVKEAPRDKPVRRGADNLAKSLHEAFGQHLDAKLRVERLKEFAIPEVANHQEPMLFAINSQVFSLACEPRFLPTFRMSFAGGSRKVATASLWGIRKLMVEEQKSTVPSTPAQLRNYWKSRVSAESLEALANVSLGGFGTLGPGDAIFLPPGIIVAEQTLNDACFGIKVNMMVPSTQTMSHLENLLEALPMNSPDVSVLQQIVKKLDQVVKQGPGGSSTGNLPVPPALNGLPPAIAVAPLTQQNVESLLTSVENVKGVGAEKEGDNAETAIHVDNASSPAAHDDKAAGSVVASGALQQVASAVVASPAGADPGGVQPAVCDVGLGRVPPEPGVSDVIMNTVPAKPPPKEVDSDRGNRQGDKRRRTSPSSSSRAPKKRERKRSSSPSPRRQRLTLEKSKKRSRSRSRKHKR